MKTDYAKMAENLVNEINKSSVKDRQKIINIIEDQLSKLNIGNGDVFDGFIYKTNDPQQFGTILGNRILKEDSIYIRNLAQSIKEFGNVSPVLINEKNEVVDGQRRILAITKYKLGVPLRYSRFRKGNIDTVGEINRLQFKWDVKDWLHKYVTIGKPDYIEYGKLFEKFGKYMRDRSMRSLFMFNRVKPFPSETWEKGKFKINEETRPDNEKFLEFLGRVYKVGAKDNVFARQRDFQKVLYEIWKSVGNINEDRFLRKIKLNFDRLNIRTNEKGYSDILFSILGRTRKVTKEDGLPKDVEEIKEIRA